MRASQTAPGCVRVCFPWMHQLPELPPSSSNDDVWPQIGKGQKESVLFATQMFFLIHSHYTVYLNCRVSRQSYVFSHPRHCAHNTQTLYSIAEGQNTLAFTSVVACLRTGVRAVCISRPASWFCIAVSGSAWDRSSRRSTSLFKAGNFSLGVIESTESFFFHDLLVWIKSF